ncbi:hypothetical protein CH281_20315 [Rhodococcus sp. 06-221-2]|nr:hypothetical protein CH281_20315 [Rhodococcus sp. 06-221-2]
MALENTAVKSFKVTYQGSNGRGSTVFTDSKYEVHASGALSVYERGDEPKTTIFGPGMWVRVEDPAPPERATSVARRLR